MINTSAARTAMASLINDNITADVSPADVRSVFTSAFDLIEKVNPVLNVKNDFGATGNGTTDDTAAIQAALNQGAWKSIFFPSGTYRTTSALTVPNINNMRLVGEGGTNTTIRMFGTGTILTLTNASFCSVEELGFQHGSGTGGGLLFSGNNGSNNVDRCLFTLNPGGNGLAFVGNSSTPQSNNKVTRCLFLENGLEQLYLYHANDSTISFNAFGSASGPYAPAGCMLENSSAGQYTNNEHWNNTNALRLLNSNFLRISSNRFEESRNEGILANNSSWCQFTGNYLHTNSKSATGTYSAIKLATCSQWNIVGNTAMSWNETRHKHSIEADGTSSAINIVGNMFEHNTGADINTSTATNVSSSANI